MKSKSRFEKIINCLLNALIFIFGIILLISIYTGIQTKLLGKDHADFFGYSLFEVQTGSMADAINPGDWIIVKNSNNIKLNDVVTYRYNGEFITHRVIESYKGTYVTQGDANNSKDDPINQDQIVGKVVKVLAGFGIFKKTIFNPAVLVALIATILLFNFLFNKKDNKESNSNNDNKVIDKGKLIAKKIMVKVHNIKNSADKKVSLAKAKKETKKKVNEQIKNEEVKNIQPVEQNNNIDEQDDYCFIPVDVSEINNTFLEIADHQIDTDKTELLEETKSTDEEMVQEKKKSNNKINLELLETHGAKKSRSIIDKVISIKIEELTELMNALDDDGKNFVNEPTIRNKFVTTYIDARYYNYYGENESPKKNTSKMDTVIKSTGASLISDYHGSDTKFNEKVDKYTNMFILIAEIDKAKDRIDDVKVKTEFYKKEVNKYGKIRGWDNQTMKSVITEIVKIQRNYVGIVDYFIKKIETNMFNLEFNKIITKKDMYGLSLEHNIAFSNVYSDYIIDKTYNEGVIAEDKIIVLLNLLSLKLVKNMMVSDFNKQYILYVPKTLYSKEKKLERLLGMLDDEYAKEAVFILVSYQDLIKYKTIIKKIRKKGYKFAIIFDRETKIDAKNYGDIYVADYIFVNKKIDNIVNTLSAIPDDLLDRVIYENIVDKVGDFGGE